MHIIQIYVDLFKSMAFPSPHAVLEVTVIIINLYNNLVVCNVVLEAKSHV